MQRGLSLYNSDTAAALGCKVGVAPVTPKQGTPATPAQFWPPSGPNAAKQWAEAYAELEFELASLRRDNDALLAEVRGRRRTQHGRRSERVTPEELLVALRQLKESDPEQVPAGMLEELEQECGQRARQRELRKASRAAKLQRRAEAAAREAAAKGKAAASAKDDGNNDDGGGGGPGGVSGVTPMPPSTPPANVIPLQPAQNSRRNACLDGLDAQDRIQAVSGEARLCPLCTEERDVIGYEDSHMLDIALPRMQALRIRQEKLACAQHPEAGVVTAAPAVRPLEQSLPTALLLAYIIVSKVADHLPLERLSGIVQRWGTRIAPSTLGDWFHRAADALAPVAEQLGKQMMASTLCLHTDGSFMRVVDPSKPGGSVQAGLWGYTVASVGAYFRVTEDQSFSDTRQQLSARDGPTMTDGHKAYQSQRLGKSKITVPVIKGLHLHCWAHARRPFEQALHLDDDRRAAVPLRMIQALYQVEAYIKQKSTSTEDTVVLRCARSEPIIDALFDHLRTMQKTVLPKSRLGQGIKSVLRREVYLRAYLRVGTLPIDNTLQESQFRSKAVGQHNWLFLGNHQAAARYAVLLTLVRSCALLGVDPLAYLENTLLRLQERGSAAALDDLLPAAMKARQSCTTVAA